MEIDVAPIAYGLGAIFATLLGGILALRFNRDIHVLLGLTAGIVLGVAVFELLPEAFALGRRIHGGFVLGTATFLGFGFYFLLGRQLADRREQRRSTSPHLGPASLTLHSLFDGISMGFAFQVSAGVGAAVALAVVTHDLCDGLNTVSLSLAGSGRRQTAWRWLLADAAAPFCGVCLAQFVHLPPAVLALLLAVFGGFFLYIAGVELLPRNYARNTRSFATVSMLAGLAISFAVSTLARA
jgi:zinc transporter ZupT